MGHPERDPRDVDMSAALSRVTGRQGSCHATWQMRAVLATSKRRSGEDWKQSEHEGDGVTRPPGFTGSWALNPPSVSFSVSFRLCVSPSPLQSLPTSLHHAFLLFFVNDKHLQPN